MIVAKNRDRTYNHMVYGNIAYDYKTSELNERKQKRSIIPEQKNNLNVKMKLKLIGIVMLTFCVGMFILSRYAFIMSLKKQYTDTQKLLSQNQKVNEELRVKLMANVDINEIENIATTQLNMVHPDNKDIVYINIGKIDKNEKVADAGKTAKQQPSLIDRIMEFFN